MDALQDLFKIAQDLFWSDSKMSSFIPSSLLVTFGLYAIGSMSLTGISLSLNGTALLKSNDTETQAALYEVKVFNITLSSVALCILTVTGIISCILYLRHRRKSERARVYESAVASEVPEEPVGVMCVRKTHSFRNPLALFRRQEGPKDNSRIHYIYTNPLPVGHKEDRIPPHTVSIHTPLTLQDYANDPNSGFILALPIFLHAAVES